MLIKTKELLSESLCKAILASTTRRQRELFCYTNPVSIHTLDKILSRSLSVSEKQIETLINLTRLAIKNQNLIGKTLMDAIKEQG